jgi:alpha-1,3-glucosyltransferase
MNPLATLVIALAALVVRCGVSLWPHSGMASPPMYGDFEAQRHWLEITRNLPVRQWYVNTTDNDLQYWGLDYPPLMAYWSLGLAYLAPNETVALGSSRGSESVATKAFMRGSVVAADLAFYLPAAWLAARGEAGPFAWLSLQPVLVLMDHGHFQYNGMSLSFSLAAVAAIAGRRECLGSALFVLSLAHKQMGLYYAPAFFFHLLFANIRRGSAVAGVARLAATVAATLALVFAPFLAGDGAGAAVAAVMGRLFPWERGLFEDKVANFWCAASPVLKLKGRYGNGSLRTMTTAVTLVALVPVAAGMWRSRRGLTWGMAVSSLAFFLFSYQVHEKQIMYPLTALTALLPGRRLTARLQAVGLITVLPLLYRDGLAPLVIAALAVLKVKVVEAALIAAFFIDWKPQALPDLWPLAIAVYGFLNFMALYLRLILKRDEGKEEEEREEEEEGVRANNKSKLN